MNTGENLAKVEMVDQNPYNQPQNNPYNQPQPQYYNQPQSSTQVIVQPPQTVTVVASPDQVPNSGVCPYCHQHAGIEVRRETSQAQWGWCVAICLLIGPCCVWIPFCMDSCDEIYYDCSKCHMNRSKHTPSMCP